MVDWPAWVSKDSPPGERERLPALRATFFSGDGPLPVQALAKRSSANLLAYARSKATVSGLIFSSGAPPFAVLRAQLVQKAVNVLRYAVWLAGSG